MHIFVNRRWYSSGWLRTTIGILFSSLVALPGFGKELTIAFGVDKPPFVFGREKRGLEIDIMREALKLKGHTVKIVHVPNRRLQIAIDTMGMDGVATVRETEDGTYYSENFITFENYAITKKQAGIVLKSVVDLGAKDLSIVAWQNAYRDLGPDFEALFDPASKRPPRPAMYSELPSQRSQNAMFWFGRADVIIVDKTIFLWYKKELAKEMDTSADVVFHEIFPKRTHFQAAFKDKQIRNDFNEGLHQLRQSGVYQQLYDKYIK